jgi:hypothetical protein
MWQRTFLYRVLQKDKMLFTVFILFILGQLFFTYKGVENTPFFHYGMYSAPHIAQQTYPVYAIVIDTTRVRSGNFFDAQREIVYNTISAYDGLQHQDFKDSLHKVITKRFRTSSMADVLRADLLNNPKMDTPYQKWLFSYIADMRMIETPRFGVIREDVAYQPDGTLRPDNIRILFSLGNE